MKTTSLQKSEVFALDQGREIGEALLHHWGGGDAICVGHAWDGVIWGRVSAGHLSIADRGARLRWETLLDLRLFDADLELRVWRRGNALEGLEVTDSETPAGEFYFRDREFELIRSPKSKPPDKEFVELKGLAGQVHYPPGPVPARLCVRLYYQADGETGLVRGVENRLLALVPWRQNR